MKWFRLSLRITLAIVAAFLAATTILWIASNNVLNGTSIAIGNRKYVISNGAYSCRVARDVVRTGDFGADFITYGTLTAILWVSLRLTSVNAPRQVLPVSTTACLYCGYDLATHGQGQKCPECGKTILQERTSVPPT